MSQSSKPSFQSASHFVQQGTLTIPPTHFEEKRPLSASHPARMVNYAFLVGMFAAYSGPLVLLLQLTGDPDVVFWVGSFGKLGFLIPIYFGILYLYQMHEMHRGHPKKWILWSGAVLPALFLCIVGGRYMSMSRYLYGQLASSDCTAKGGLFDKPLLQDAYDEAHDMLNTCHARLVKDNGGAQLERLPVLQSCEEWVNTSTAATGEIWSSESGFLSNTQSYLFGSVHNWPHGHEHDAFRTFHSHNDPSKVTGLFDPPKRKPEDDAEKGRLFEYLATVEANHVCGGFCTPGPRLWSPKDAFSLHGNACSKFVALKMLTVEHEGVVLFWTSVLAAALGLVCLELGGSGLDKLGFVW